MLACRFLILSVVISLEVLCIAACPTGDLDEDCSVGLGDLVVFANSWMDDAGSNVNLDGLGKVDIRDFAILARHWGKSEYQLLINEFMANNKGTIEDPDEAGQYPDWIEIYNPNAVPIDIGGMYLTDKLTIADMWQIPSNAPTQTTIQPGGYLIIWADSETTQGPLHANFNLGAGGEEIGLFDTTGTQLDAITFGSQNADESYGRYPNGGPGWQTFANGTATPRSSNGGESADAGILINEIMYHPGHNEAAFEPEPINLEYIELYNTGTSTVDIGGWRLVDGVQFEMPVDTTIAADGYLVIAADETAFSAAYPSISNVVGGWTGKLSNKGEKITLVNTIGTEIDVVHYYDDGDWNRRILGPLDHFHRGWQWSNAHDGAGYSLELICNSVSNEYGRNWQAGSTPGGTPGAANDYKALDLAPIVLDVGHSPVIPTASQAVTVTAEVLDENLSGVSVYLHWRLDTSTYGDESVYPTYNPASYNTAVMFDDGTHGDGQPGDGVYGASIPPQADGEVMEFFIKAADAGANMRTWPAACDIDGSMQQVANCLYQVDDTFDAAADWTPGSVPQYFLIMTEGERARLEDMGDDTQPTGNEFTAECASNANMNATFISIDGVDTKVRYTIGVRNRGNTSRHTPPMNYHFGFRHDDKWKNVTALNINAEYPYVQVMGSAIWKMAGIPTPTCNLIELKVNGSNLATDSSMHGHYAALESYNADWAQNNFPEDPDGNLYRCTYWTITNDADRTYADLEHHGIAPYRDPADYWVNYMKETNGSEQDWSDVFDLIDILMNSSGTEDAFLASAEQAVDVDQWMRFLATDYLCGNSEAGFSYGMGDDYAMYRPAIDTRFWLLPHDLGSMLGQDPGVNNTSIFSCDRHRLEGIHRLINNKDVLQRYYSTFFELIDTAYSPEQFDPLIDVVLGDKVPSNTINAMKQFVVNRQNGSGQILDQIPQDFTIVGPAFQNGYSHTTSSTATLSGTFNAATARSIKVDGQLVPDANWNQKVGTWSISGISLNPGINNIAVEAFSQRWGTGDSVYKGSIDVWYDDGSVANVTSLTGNVVLDAASGPWYIASSMTVPAGSTLTIQPGTTVYFGSGARLTVNGRLVAEGTEFNRISLIGGNPPSTSTSWGGIRFSSSNQDNRLVCVDMRSSSSAAESIRLDNSRLLADSMTWSQTNDVILQIESSSAIVRNCLLPDNTGDQSVSGHLLLSADPYLIFDNNTFGVHTGTKKDVLDCTVSGPWPVPQFTNNVFLGGGDDALDLDGTHAFVAGNTFMNFHRNFPATDGESYAVTSGYDGSNTSNHMIVRNLFIDCDNAALVKDRSWINFQNNTVVNCQVGVNFREPLETTVDPGMGGYLAGNIFYNTPDPVSAYYINDPTWGTSDVTIEYSIIPDGIPAQFLGSGNIINADALFVDAESDYQLKADSAAIGTGVNGIDMGSQVPAGASISGQQNMMTPRTYITFTIAGPGLTHYKWRLDSGSWSVEQTVDTPISLSGLSQSSHTLEVIGKNYAGLWQDPADATIKNWAVDTSWRILQISEVLAANTSIAREGTYPDMIELYYDGANSIDLGGYRITDNNDLPGKFIFAAGTIMNPGDYLFLYADSNTLPAGIHTGFRLDADGDDLYLLDPSAEVIDSVEFGAQLENLSIGRLADGQWNLTVPTMGSANIKQPLGDPANLKINEWLADGKILHTDDIIELYNSSSNPVNLSDLYLTDNYITKPLKSSLGPLSFIGPNGYAVLVANGSNAKGHVNFNLSADHEIIALFDADKNEIDKVWYGPQTTDASQGRVPDGGTKFKFFDLPTLGASNANVSTIVTRTNLIDMTDVWSYEQSGTDLGTSWRNTGYNDSAWSKGAALLYVESSSLPAPKNTLLTVADNINTYYFRKHFFFNGDPAEVDELELTTVLDDAAAIYLNGAEIKRIRLNTPVTYGSVATNVVSNAAIEIFGGIPATALVNGDNVIAVEVHQGGSPPHSDIVWGCELDAIGTTTSSEDMYADSRGVLEGLRITEIMYNPAADPNSEFIELKNISNIAINLEGVRFTNGIDFVFPQITLSPGQYTVVVANQIAFEARYGTQIYVAGVYTGKLGNSGEQITLKLAEPLDAAVMRFEYRDGWYPTTDGVGYSLVITDATGPLESWRDEENWHPSYAAGGTPGADDIAGVIISEVLAHSHDTAPDWIELYNPMAQAANIGGWFLSDSAGNLKKYQIADGTTIYPGDYLVLYEDIHFGNATDPGSLEQFALSENGDQAYLSSGDSGSGELTGYTVEVSFGASETDVSFGRYTKSDGTTVFVLMDSMTPDEDNSGPKVGPIVISEIMYNPPAGGSYASQEYEYIELHNITGSPVTLEYYDGQTLETLGWQFTEGIDFTFPLGTTIPANGYLVIARSPAAFAERYGSVASPVLGPFENDTKLSNGGELLELSMPGDTDLLGNRHYIHADSVLYDNEAPWPATPDGAGDSLDRVIDAAYGNDVANWQASTPKPKR